MTRPFPPNLQHILTAKPLELRTWNFDTIFTIPCVSHVTCDMSCVMCHLSRVSWHHYFQTVWARELMFLDNVHHPLFVTCHVSCVKCNMSHVKCRKKKPGQIGGAIWWRVCCQCGPTLSIFNMYRANSSDIYYIFEFMILSCPEQL